MADKVNQASADAARELIALKDLTEKHRRAAAVLIDEPPDDIPGTVALAMTVSAVSELTDWLARQFGHYNRWAKKNGRPTIDGDGLGGVKSSARRLGDLAHALLMISEPRWLDYFRAIGEAEAGARKDAENDDQGVAVIKIDPNGSISTVSGDDARKLAEADDAIDLGEIAAAACDCPRCVARNENLH